MSNDNNQTNEIPWTCYRNYHDDDPKNWWVASFVDRHGRKLEFSQIHFLDKFHEYVLASQIGEWLLTGRRVLDFGNLSIRVRIKNLCDKIHDGGLEQAVYERNKSGRLVHLFIRAFTEFQYQTNPVSLITARNLRFYETKCDIWYGSFDDCEVHHILPKCEFEKFETDLRNLVKLPTPVHQLLHKVYKDINKKKEPGEAFCERWLGVVPRGFVDSEHDLELPESFFEDICHNWFNQRTSVDVINQKIAREICCSEDYVQTEFNLVMKCDYFYEDGILMGKNYYVVRTDSYLPWWWTQHWATIANMCAYIYADALHRRLA